MHKRAGAKEEGSVGHATRNHEENRLVSSGIRVAHFGDLITALIIGYKHSFAKLRNQTTGAILQIIEGILAGD